MSLPAGLWHLDRLNKAGGEMAQVAYWFYTSVSTTADDNVSGVVNDIVTVSVPRNGALTVTGALIFTGTRFVQFLEGPSSAVRDLRASIGRDRRHINVRTIAAGTAERRRFAHWSLAYAGTTACFDELVRLSDLLKPSSAQILLAEMIRRFASMSPADENSRIAAS